MRKNFNLLMLALVGVLLWAGAVYGATLTVRKDGSGDFQVIQDAVNAASDGDVIDIGPGRWDDYELIWYDGTPAWNVYVFIDGKSLTLQGAGAGQTVLGPEDEDFHPWPGRDTFIVMGINCGELKIYDMTLEHSPWEIVGYRAWNQQFEMARCVVREGNRGVIVACPAGGSVTDSEFMELDDYGVSTLNPTNDFIVSNCTFANVFGPVAADWSPSHVDVSDCTMDGGRLGVGFFGGASGSVTNCYMTNFQNYGIALNDPGAVTITNNTIEQATGWGMALGDGEQAVITNNLIRTETGTCLFLPYPCDGMVFEGNDLYRGDGDFVKTNDYWPYETPVYFHLENNYWGTTDAAEIQAHIIDGYVQDQVNMFVVYEPFEGASVPTESQTLGGVKALYRH